MHTMLPFLLAMIVAIVLLEMWADKLKIAYPILLVVAGLLISFIPGLPVVKINPDLIFLYFYLHYYLKLPGLFHLKK